MTVKGSLNYPPRTPEPASSRCIFVEAPYSMAWNQSIQLSMVSVHSRWWQGEREEAGRCFELPPDQVCFQVVFAPEHRVQLDGSRCLGSGIEDLAIHVSQLH